MVNNLIMRPVCALVFHRDGELESRIGPEIRKTKYAELKHLEELIIQHSLLPISGDIAPIHPPFFTEFSYTDVFDGFLISTLSSEINFRLAESLQTPQPHIEKFFTRFQDKYNQSSLSDGSVIPDKIIFMTGTNLFLKVVDTNKLDEQMATEDWYIKPHPLSNENHLREYAAKYGYHRILDKSLSGHALYAGAKEIGGLATSEFSIRAIIDGKPLTDFTAFSEKHSHVYSAFTEAARLHDNSSRRIKDMLSDKESGYLFPGLSDSENIDRLHAYQKKAISLREPFRMKTHQQLLVRRKPEPPQSPQPPQKRKSS